MGRGRVKVFVDTSAFYASINPDDLHHVAARKILDDLENEGAQLLTTNYVLLECASLIQRRKGFSPTKEFLVRVHESVDVLWINERAHRESLTTWEKGRSRGLSLVDCASFSAMRQAGIRRALAFDPHFAQHGFEVIP